MRLLLVAPLALAACGGAASAPDAHLDASPQDAAPPAPLCGAPFPTIAPASIAISGRALAVDPAGHTSTAGVMVAVRAGATTLASGPVDTSTGAFAFSIATGGAPIDAHLHASASGSVDFDLYPPAPLAADYAAQYPLALISASGFHGVVLAGTASCATPSQPIAGATIVLDPAGGATESYVDDGGASSPAPTAKTIAAQFVGAAPGPSTVSAHQGAIAFRDRSIEIAADTLVQVELEPR